MVEKKYHIINIVYGTYWITDQINTKAIFTQAQVDKYINGHLELEPILIEEENESKCSN